MYEHIDSSLCSAFEVELGSRSGSPHPHSHVFHELILCTSGKGIQYFRDGAFEMIPGNLFFLPAGEPHGALGTGSESCRCLVLSLGEMGWVGEDIKGDRELGWILKALTSEADAGRPGSMLGEPDRIRAEELLNTLIDALARSHTGFRVEIKSLLLQLFSLLLQRPRIRNAFRKTEIENRIDDGELGRFGLLKNYLTENYWEKITVEKALRLTHMSRSHFHASFRETFSCTLGEYVTNLRLEAARKELLTSDKSPANIALDCGFPSLSNFYRCFKKAYQQTPAALQRG